MKRLLITFAIAISLSLAMALTPLTARAAGMEENKSGDNGKATRTVMLYLCGSNLESQSALATYNLRQILKSEFSKDEDIRFIIMTGGAGYLQTDPDWLIFSEGVHVPEDAVQDVDENGFPVTLDKTSQVSNTYNQLWEARGADAPDNTSKMVLLDGDGITGEEVPSSDELMSNPKTMKAFINYGVENYPAEKYDLILWDHGAGPTGGFGVDEHEEGIQTMSFSGITDDLSDNAVTKNDADGEGKLPSPWYGSIDQIGTDKNFLECGYGLSYGSGFQPKEEPGTARIGKTH